MKIKAFIFRLFIIIVIFIGYFFTFESTLYDLYSKKTQNIVMSDYIDSVSEEDNVDKALKDAKAYNEKIVEEQKIQPFQYMGENETDDEYESLLSVSEAMCCLDIPSISISLPVAHGTHTERLSYAAGHLYGTSLPVGGGSTHAVIAAHSALSTAKLFTDLYKLQIGDDFYITIFGQKHRYVVDQIDIELPLDADKKLQVADGEDYVTLYTCTPYAVNTHRLLVRGKRDTQYADEQIVEELKNENEQAYKLIDAKIAFIELAPFVLLLVYIVLNIVKLIKQKLSLMQ